MGDPGDCRSESLVVCVLMGGGEAVDEADERDDCFVLAVVVGVEAVLKSVVGSVVPG